MLLTISEAARLLGVCENTLRDWDESGKFRAARTEGHRRYSLEQVRKYLEANEKVEDVEEVICEDDRLLVKWGDWLEGVYGEDDKRSTAILLENASGYYDATNSDATNSDATNSEYSLFSKNQYLTLTKQSWLKTRFRKMVNVQALLQPCGLVYYMKNCKIEEEAVVVKTVKYNFTIFHNSKFEDVCSSYGDTIAAETDNIILGMLPKIDTETIRNVKFDLTQCYDYIIGPEKFLNDLKGRFAGVATHSIPTILDSDSFLFLAAAGKYASKWDLPIFSPYILCLVGPKLATNVHSCMGRFASLTGGK